MHATSEKLRAKLRRLRELLLPPQGPAVAESLDKPVIRTTRRWRRQSHPALPVVRAVAPGQPITSSLGCCCGGEIERSGSIKASAAPPA